MADAAGTATATDTGTASTAEAGEAASADADTAAVADPTAQADAAVQSAADKPSTEPASAAKPRDNLTARLAALSRENREATKRATAAERAAEAAEARAREAAQKAADLDGLLTRAKDDPTIIPKLFERAGLSFEKVVNFYAEQGNDKTPEQIQAQAIEDLRKEIADGKAEREKERKESEARKLESQRLEQIAGIADTIKTKADKYEICARLGDEAANDVLTEVSRAWISAGRPELMPGEYEEAVEAAIDLMEARYEERGKKLQKAQKAADAAASTATATNSKTKGEGLVPKGDPLPNGLTPSKLSDKDEDILRGLTDKTAPSYDSQRARPRTINSSLGGSAPPKAPARGSMDPRDALREVLAPFAR